jgi:hypothetical protein
MELYCDPEVQFGGMKVGGIRISRMSHIDGDKSMALTATRGKKGSTRCPADRPLRQQRPKTTAAARSTRAAHVNVEREELEGACRCWRG